MKITNQKRIRFYYVAGLLVIFFGLCVSFKFTLSTGNLPWFEGWLCIDGNTYVEGMISIAKSNNFLNLKDIHHSPGYQIYLGLIYKFFPYVDKVFYIIKMISWVMSLLCASFIFYLGKKYFSQHAGFVAAILFAWSNKYLIYINLLQPEVLLGFLLLMYVFFQVKALVAKSRNNQLFLLFISGMLSLVICLIQVRYLFIVPFGCLSIFLRHRTCVMNKKKGYKNILFPIFVFLLPFILIFATWSIYQSLLRHRIIVGQDGVWRLSIRIGNNLNSLGSAYPLNPEIKEPAGFQFIISQPKRFLWLVAQRFLFFWDLKKDVWYLGTPVTDWLNLRLATGIFDTLFYLLCCFSFFAGFLLKAKSDLNSSLITTTSPFYLTFLASIMGPLLIFSSSRFLIPSIPLIVLFQAYFIIWFFQILKIQTTLLKFEKCPNSQVDRD